MCIRWVRYYNVWMDGPFEYLEPEFVEETTDEYHKEFIKVQKYYKNKIKADQVSSNLLKFRVSFFYVVLYVQVLRPMIIFVLRSL